MAINRNYTDKSEWQRGYDYGHDGIVKALNENPNKTKQGIYIAGRMFNKKMAKENVTDNPKSNDFLAGMETAIQEEFQTRWQNAPAEPITFSNVAGMPGLIRMNVPAFSYPVPAATQIKKMEKIEPEPTRKKTQEKQKNRFEDLEII